MLVPSTRTLMVKEALDPTLTNAGIGALLGGGIGGGIGYFGADDDEDAWARAGRGAGLGALGGAALGGGATELGRWYGPRQEASRLKEDMLGQLPDMPSGEADLIESKIIDQFRKLPRHEQLAMLTLPGSGGTPGRDPWNRDPGENSRHVFGANLGNFMSMPGRMINEQTVLETTPTAPLLRNAILHAELDRLGAGG